MALGHMGFGPGSTFRGVYEPEKSVGSVGKQALQSIVKGGTAAAASSPLGPIVSAITGLGTAAMDFGGAMIGGAMTAAGARRANRMNMALAREQMSFQERMQDKQMGFQERLSNTAWQRAVQDMRSAGINPMVAFSQGGASTPSGSAPQGARAHVENEIAPAVASAIALKRMSLEVATVREQLLNIRSQTALNAALARSADVRSFSGGAEGIMKILPYLRYLRGG